MAPCMFECPHMFGHLPVCLDALQMFGHPLVFLDAFVCVAAILNFCHFVFF